MVLIIVWDIIISHKILALCSAAFLHKLLRMMCYQEFYLFNDFDLVFASLQWHT